MNTTTNTRGVSEAMVAELIAAGDFLAMNGTDGMVRRWEKAKAALSAPEPAAQGEAAVGRKLDAPRDGFPSFTRGFLIAVGNDQYPGPVKPSEYKRVWLIHPNGEDYYGPFESEDHAKKVARSIESPLYTAPPAQPADSKVIGADSQIKPERVPEGMVLVPAEASDADAFMVLYEYQQPGRTRKDAYRIAIRKLAERAAPSPARGDGGEG